MGCSVTVYRFDNVYYSYRPLRIGRLLAVVDGRAHPIDSVVGLSGCRVVVERVDGVVGPGFVDAHLHLEGLVLSKIGVDLSGVESVDEMLEIVGKAANQSKDVVFGRGWSVEKVDVPPTRWELDDVVDDKPVILVSGCGHIATLNTVALKLFGLWDVETEDLERTCECKGGEPTGIVYGDLISLVVERLLEYVDPVDVLGSVLGELVSSGITGLASMDASRWLVSRLPRLYGEAKGALPRVALYPGSWLLNSPTASVATCSGSPGVCGVKLYADGSLGARTAWLREPYRDAPWTRGRPYLTEDKLLTLVSKALNAGLRVAVHAIGDAALDLVLHVYQSVGCKGCRVEHASLAHRDHWAIMCRLGVWAVVQPGFLVHDTWLSKRLGKERAGIAYQWKAMLDAGVKLAIGSDAPVEPYDPLWNLDAITSGGENPHLSRSPGIPLQHALHMYTRAAAEAVGWSDVGCLEQGFRADLVVFSDDPFEQPKGELKDNIEIIGVAIGGKWARYT